MNVNLFATIVQWSVFFFMLAAIPRNPKTPDTLKISSTGEHNSIIIDTMQWLPQVTDTTTAKSVAGEINQAGENNSVEIQTRREALTSKKPVTSNLKPETIKIKQTGKNNSIKINSK